MVIVKGKPFTVSTAFLNKGVPVVFAQPPLFTILNETSDILLSGAAVPNGTKWEVTFTIPLTYIVQGGEETLTVVFEGTSNTKRTYTSTKEVTLNDASNEYVPIGLVYSLIDSSTLVDTIFSQNPQLESVTYRMQLALSVETTVFSKQFTNLTSTNLTTNGYEYKLDLGRPDVSAYLNALDPIQGIVEIKATPSSIVDVEAHPIYLLTTRILGFCNSLKQYLDKASLKEIDPSMQWYLPDYVHGLYEGIRYVNSIGEATSWCLNSFPESLRPYVIAAAAYTMLNARYLAEGFNAFEFSGLNTSLNYDRRDTITYKIDELGNYINDKLVTAKTAAIRSGYTTSTALATSSIDAAKSSFGVIGLQGSAVSNRLSLRKPFRRWVV